MTKHFRLLSFYIPEEFEDMWVQFNKIIKIDKAFFEQIKSHNKKSYAGAALRKLVEKYVAQRQHLLTPKPTNETLDATN